MEETGRPKENHIPVLPGSNFLTISKNSNEGLPSMQQWNYCDQSVL
jgi:hypothetical protein